MLECAELGESGLGPLVRLNTDFSGMISVYVL